MRLMKYKIASLTAPAPAPSARHGPRLRSTSNGRRMPFTRASSPAEPELLSAISRGSSSPKPRRPEITRSTRPTARSRRRRRHRNWTEMAEYQFLLQLTAVHDLHDSLLEKTPKKFP